MRTTVVLPDDILSQIRKHQGASSLSGFVRESVEYRLEALDKELLVREMEEGYRAESEDPSLDPEWSEVETEDL